MKVDIDRHVGCETSGVLGFGSGFSAHISDLCIGLDVQGVDFNVQSLRLVVS